LRNSIKDIDANRATHTDSDHYPVIIKYKRALAKPKEKEEKTNKNWKGPILPTIKKKKRNPER
jgi:hypothetical protein